MTQDDVLFGYRLRLFHLDDDRHDYNHHRAHTGRKTAGRWPAERVYAAHKMEPR